MRSAPRNIVFVINSLTAGGAEHALVDMLAYLEDHLRSYIVHLVLLDIEEELHAVPAWVQKHVLNANFSFLWSTISLTRLLRGLAPAVTVSFLNRSNCANVLCSKIGWGESPVEDQVRAAGQVSDRRLREGPCRRRGAASRQAGEEGLRLCRQSRLRLQSKTSMEIRKKLNAILSSKSRLAKAPRLKGATWVLRADC